MSCIVGLLRNAAPALEAQVQSRLQGFFGAMLRHYLPQIWVFRTEEEVASLEVDPGGHVAVHDGARVPPDVTIEVGHERLRRALGERTRPAPTSGPPARFAVTTHTAKGKAAYGLLRDRLGLPA